MVKMCLVKKWNMYTFMRTHQSVFQSGCTVLHAYWRGVSSEGSVPSCSVVWVCWGLIILWNVQGCIIVFVFLRWHNMQNSFSSAHFPDAYLCDEMSTKYIDLSVSWLTGFKHSSCLDNSSLTMDLSPCPWLTFILTAAFFAERIFSCGRTLFINDFLHG